MHTTRLTSFFIVWFLFRSWKSAYRFLNIVCVYLSVFACCINSNIHRIHSNNLTTDTREKKIKEIKNSARGIVLWLTHSNKAEEFNLIPILRKASANKMFESIRMA